MQTTMPQTWVMAPENEAGLYSPRVTSLTQADVHTCDELFVRPECSCCGIVSLTSGGSGGGLHQHVSGGEGVVNSSVASQNTSLLGNKAGGWQCDVCDTCQGQWSLYGLSRTRLTTSFRHTVSAA